MTDLTNKEFEQLQRTIQQKTIELNKLQARHREITGQYFVISGPLPEPEALRDHIRRSQVSAGERAVADNLKKLGF